MPATFRAWNVVLTGLFFASVYASIHRLWIPLAFRFTPLSNSPFAHPDPWFVPGIALALTLRRTGKFNGLSVIVAGWVVGFGISEAIKIGMDVYEGWLALSHGISSAPMALAAFALLLFRDRGSRPAPAWAGAGAALAWAMAGPLAPAIVVADRAPNDSVPALTVLRTTHTAEEAQVVCGARDLVVRAAHVPATDKIFLESCGFRAGYVTPASERLRIENVTGQALNVHFIVVEHGRSRTAWNFVLRGHTFLRTPPLGLRSQAYGILYSDSSPAAGLVLVVPDSARAGTLVTASRSRLKVVEP